MPSQKPFKTINVSLKGFQRSLKKCAVRGEATAAIAAMLEDPLPVHLKFKKLNGYRNPALYSITICNNQSHKISFEIRDEVAILRRVGTHKQIDDNP